MHVAQQLRNRISNRARISAPSPRCTARTISAPLLDDDLRTPEPTVPIMKLPSQSLASTGSPKKDAESEGVSSDGGHYDGGQPQLGYQQWHPSVTILFAGEEWLCL